jgi:hypothetical protein
MPEVRMFTAPLLVRRGHVLGDELGADELVVAHLHEHAEGGMDVAVLVQPVDGALHRDRASGRERLGSRAERLLRAITRRGQGGPEALLLGRLFPGRPLHLIDHDRRPLQLAGAGLGLGGVEPTGPDGLLEPPHLQTEEAAHARQGAVAFHYGVERLVLLEALAADSGGQETHGNLGASQAEVAHGDLETDALPDVGIGRDFHFRWAEQLDGTLGRQGNVHGGQRLPHLDLAGQAHFRPRPDVRLRRPQDEMNGNVDARRAAIFGPARLDLRRQGTGEGCQRQADQGPK